MDDYGLSASERAAIDELMPGWEDMRPAEIQQRAASIQEQFEAETEDFYALRDLIFSLVGQGREQQ